MQNNKLIDADKFQIAVRVINSQLIDNQGRSLILRGVNLGSNSKMPVGTPELALRNDIFFNYKNVSFIGRPFPLEEADIHFKRLSEWGFTFLRFLVTWEAVEHSGPGIYDEEYLAYLHAVVKKAGEHGFHVLIDFHQDVWSRWTGGDGAPGWTLEAVGFNIQNITQTFAATLHDIYDKTLPHMTWFTNGTKLAAATMFTLFFGGNDFAPNTKINGKPVQDYLQEHYLYTVLKVVSRLSDLSCVIGYEPMNEPSQGYIGWEDITLPKIIYNHGVTPSPLQSMLIGMGHAQNVGVWKRHFSGTKQAALKTVNTEAVKVWLEGFNCVWHQNKVWDFDADGTPHVLNPLYFTEVNGKKIDFLNDYLRPFSIRFSKTVRSIFPEAIIFIEGDSIEKVFELSKGDIENAVFAPHWYDTISLIKKKYMRFISVDNFKQKLVFGFNRGRLLFVNQLKWYREISEKKLGNIPVIIGEIGIPFDLHNAKAYRTGDFYKQEMAMDKSLSAADGALVGYTIWNYNPDNDNTHGDYWNGEDLSIFSKDQHTDVNDINSGGRALKAIIRPYPIATAGIPVKLSFDYKKGTFSYTFTHDQYAQAPTEIFVPSYHYSGNYLVDISDGSFEKDVANQRLFYMHGTIITEHTIRITRSRN